MTVLIRGIFDSHAHYGDPSFDPDREELLSSLPEQGVCGILDIGCCLESSRASAALAASHRNVWAAVGYHPEHADLCTDEGLAEIEGLLSQPRVAAIGEIGLDYYWPEPDHETQKRVFIKQLEMARRLDKPVILHVREATKDALDILREHNKKSPARIADRGRFRFSETCYHLSLPFPHENGLVEYAKRILQCVNGHSRQPLLDFRSGRGSERYSAFPFRVLTPPGRSLKPKKSVLILITAIIFTLTHSMKFVKIFCCFQFQLFFRRSGWPDIF